MSVPYVPAGQGRGLGRPVSLANVPGGAGRQAATVEAEGVGR